MSLQNERRAGKPTKRMRQVDGEDVLEGLISRYGWAIRGCDAADDGAMPVYAYTVGLARVGIPDLMVVGMPHPMCGGLLNELAGQQVEAAKAGEKTIPGPLVMDGVERRLYLVPIAHDAVAKYAPEVLEANGSSRWPILQLVWADMAGALPWEGGFARSGIDQPVLGTVPGQAH
jgi:hypothetical protein